MNWKIFAGILCLIFCITTNSFASYVGSLSNPVKQDEWKIELFSDNVSSKKFFIRTAPLPAGAIYLTDAKVTDLNSNGFQLSYGLFDDLTMFLRFGQADRTLETKWTDGYIIELGYDNTDMYGGGLKFVQEIEGVFTWALELQFNTYAGENVTSITENGTSADLIWPGEGKMREFQGSLSIGKEFGVLGILKIFPYLGCIVNDTRIKVDETSYIISAIGTTIYKMELEENRSFGWAAGIDLKLSERLNINVESRHYTEAAYTIGIGFNF